PNHKSRRQLRHHFTLMSTLRRAAAAAVTVTDRRCSPSSGWRNTTSWLPIGSDTLAIGVSPTRSPSINTSAQGDALTLSVLRGQSSLIAATFPDETSTVRVER